MNITKKPCRECPFKKDSLEGWLGDYNAQTFHSMVMGEGLLPCHMSMDKDIDDTTEIGSKKYPVCRGSLAYRKKNCKLSINDEINDLQNSIDISECDNILTVPEFFEHHENARSRNEYDKIDEECFWGEYDYE